MWTGQKKLQKIRKHSKQKHFFNKIIGIQKKIKQNERISLKNENF